MSLSKLSFYIFCTCVVVLGMAYFIEYKYLLSPCPLCSLQRFIFILIATACLLGSIIKVKGWIVYLYSTNILFLAIIGQALAARQLWLQYFAPPQTTSCAAGIERLIELYPLLEALKLALGGSAECAAIDFTIFDLSLATWSFILFAVISITMLYVIFKQKKGGP